MMVSNASADLLVYEPFDYASGSDLLNQNGGGGFAADWTGRDNDDGNVPAGSSVIQAGSLAHPTQPGDLPTGGGHVLMTGENGTTQPAREFSAAAQSAIGSASSIWVSFLAQRQGEALTGVDNPYPRGVNVSLFDSALSDEKTGVGNSSGASDNTWSIIPDGSGSQREGAYDPPGGIAGGGPENVGAATFPYEDLQWAVYRIDFNVPGGGEDMYLWLSPDPTTEPNITDADAQVLSTDSNYRTLAGIGGMRPFVGAFDSGNNRPFGVLVMDEFRVGTTYGDMTGTSVVPEPTTCLLSLLGLLAIGACRVRR